MKPRRSSALPVLVGSLLPFLKSSLCVKLSTDSEQIRGGRTKNPSDLEKLQFLSLINQKRCMHGAEPVEWDDAVAAGVGSHIDSLTSAFAYAHPQSMSTGPAAEVVFHTTSGGWPSPRDAVESWYSEIQNCATGAPLFTDGCRVAKPGTRTYRFTAMIWSTVRTVGCGTATSSAGVSFILCRFKAGDQADQDFPNAGDSENFAAHVSAQRLWGSQCGSDQQGYGPASWPSTELPTVEAVTNPPAPEVYVPANPYAYLHAWPETTAQPMVGGWTAPPTAPKYAPMQTDPPTIPPPMLAPVATLPPPLPPTTTPPLLIPQAPEHPLLNITAEMFDQSGSRLASARATRCPSGEMVYLDECKLGAKCRMLVNSTDLLLVSFLCDSERVEETIHPLSPKIDMHRKRGCEHCSFPEIEGMITRDGGMVNMTSVAR
eukprot:gb/GFBE01046751.1/.p1 GENE.gb/GFBE01046751.1/~~gb/GFBE01046751.1/.p1  ORF type:complete len:430 (+),score=38.20 gb/GFBE01046751.1/:1-1290(+)